MTNGLRDTFGRSHNSLRVSVTDRCNIRCFYCMPERDPAYVARAQILSYEEIERFVRIAVGLGVNRVRITGGEPLVRRDVPDLVRRLAAIHGIEDLSLTTNGVLLEGQAPALYAAGLRRINIHLDTLDRERFLRIARRDEIDRVLAGIASCRRAGFDPIKINAVAVKGLVEPDLVPLARFGRDNGMEVRFIEFMPLDAQGIWDRGSVLTAGEIVETLSREIAPLVEMPAEDPRAPATRIPLRRRPRPGRLHRLGEPAVLSQLQPHPADRRRPPALLPVRDRGDGRAVAVARRGFRRRNRRGDPGHRPRQVGRPRNQHRPLRGPAAAHVLDWGVGGAGHYRSIDLNWRPPAPKANWGLLRELPGFNCQLLKGMRASHRGLWNSVESGRAGQLQNRLQCRQVRIPDRDSYDRPVPVASRVTAFSV